MIEMRDILLKKGQKPIQEIEDLNFFLEDAFLSYKWNYAGRYFRDIEAIKKYVSPQVYIGFIRIGESHFHCRKEDII